MFSKLARSSWCFAAFVVACGSGANSGAASAESRDAGSDVDADAATVAYETLGPYRCCAEGTGTACCEGTPQGTCFEHGGLYGACRAAGEQYEAKVICARCCEGLEHRGILEPGNRVGPDVDGLPDGCDAPAPPSLRVCIRCGDGTCGPGENFCNCPADCPR